MMHSTQHVKHENSMKVIRLNTYTIRDFIVTIYSSNGYKYYEAKPIFDFEQYPFLYTQLVSIVYENKMKLGKKIYSFDELLDLIKSMCLWKIMETEGLKSQAEAILEIFFFKLIKFYKLIPLFLDDMVNEIYLDSKYSAIYLDHQEFGRCFTNIYLTPEDLGALLTRLKLEHPICVSSANPSLKTELKTRFFHLRISMDFPPLSPNGPSFNIRKLRKKPISIYDLIKFKSIHPIAAAYLIAAVKKRRNITIVGEPNSGKTTLANAIDMFTPSYWRKITVEDAIETIDKNEYGYNQLSLQVDSFESDRKLYTKSKEILKLLHRSPDWIFLGEIQSEEHTRAMFEALTAGLKGIQTAHADSIQNLIRRWKNRHGISETDLLSLEIIVIMKKELKDSKIIRCVSEIYEVKGNQYTDNLDFLVKIYDKNWDMETILQNMKESSLLRDELNTILKIKDNLMSSLQKGNPDLLYD